MDQHDPTAWTDETVSRLPLHQARAELLEEIMSTTIDRDLPSADPHRPRRWLVPMAAAAAVVTLASATLWWSGGDAGPGSDASSAAAAATPSTDADAGVAPEPTTTVTGHYGLLDEPGWTVDNTNDDTTGGEVGYRQGEQELEITWYPAASYEDYVEDRRHINEPPRDGAPVTVLDRSGQLWAYSADDHTVIREPQGGFWTEVRGSGMDRTAFRTLLDRVRLVDVDTFEASLPDDYVDASERAGAITTILDEIAAVSGKGLPSGVSVPTSGESDPYHLGADVAGFYTCAWLDELVSGEGDGDEARRVLGTARRWPVLLEMAEEGDYSELIWDLSDEVRGGGVPRNYREGLGC